MTSRITESFYLYAESFAEAIDIYCKHSSDKGSLKGSGHAKPVLVERSWIFIFIYLSLEPVEEKRIYFLLFIHFSHTPENVTKLSGQ